MYNRLIVFLLRRKFGLKVYEGFRFSNQRSKVNTYCFTRDELLKEDVENGIIRPSNVKLNFLLSDKCQIVKADL